jgi:hypothetical protein
MQRKYFRQLQAAQSDEIAPGLKGNLVHLAIGAASGITSQAEREAVAILLLQKARELRVDDANLRATAAGLITRYDARQIVSAHQAEIGARGGASTSEAKAEAARVNGAKGGRPKKKQAE